MRIRPSLFVALLGGFLPLSVLGEAEDPAGFRVVKEEENGVVTLIIRSAYASEFAVTVEASLKNMIPSRPVPFTVDAAGRTSFVLVRFTRRDQSRSWHYDYHYYRQVGARRSTSDNDADYAMPFLPGRYVVMQGPRGTYSHFVGSGSENAVDWTCPVGTTICAARAGRVVGVKQDSDRGGPNRDLRPYGNYIIIKHEDGTCAYYVHLQHNGARVRLGDEVAVGQPIGLSGQTGFASKPHLHFEVFQAIDGKKKLSLPFRLKTGHGTFTQFIRGQAY